MNDQPGIILLSSPTEVLMLSYDYAQFLPLQHIHDINSKQVLCLIHTETCMQVQTHKPTLNWTQMS